MMKMIRAVCGVLLVGLLAAVSLGEVGGTGAATAPAGQRWTELRGVRYVMFDQGNKPWYETGEKATLDEIRKQVEKGAGEKLGTVGGASILLFDSKNRVWLLPREQQDLLLCYDFGKKQWRERKAFPQDPKEAKGLPGHQFRGDAYESKTGVVYIAGLRGVYTLNGEAWGYQPFFDINIEKNLYNRVQGNRANKQFNRIRFAEAWDGTVYAWAKWGMPTEWTGTLGCWRHDGTGWRQMYMDFGTKGVLDHQGHICELASIGRDYLIVNYGNENVEDSYIFATGKVMEEQVQLELRRMQDNSAAERERAAKTLHDMGRFILPQLREELGKATEEEEKSAIASVVGAIETPPWVGFPIDSWQLWGVHVLDRDAKGNLYLLASSSVSPEGKRNQGSYFVVSPEEKVSLVAGPIHPGVHFMLTRRGHTYLQTETGISRVEGNAITPVVSPQDRDYSEVLGEDNEGRLYLMSSRWGFPETTLRPPETHVVLLDPRLPDTRPTLPSERYPQASYFAPFFLDTRGRFWTQFSPKEQPFLSYFEGGKWVHVPLPEHSPKKFKFIGVIEPLADGGLLASCEGCDGAFVFADGKWRAYATLDACVEAEAEVLRKQLINVEQRSEARYFLRKDGAGNLWINDMNKPRVYAGTQWLLLSDSPDAKKPWSLVSLMEPGDGNRMLLGGLQEVFYGEVQGNQVRMTASPEVFKEISSDLGYNPMGLRVDSKNRTWVRFGRQQQGAYFDEKGRHDLPGSWGNANLEDKEGRIWFINHVNHRVSVFMGDGRSADFPVANVATDSCLAEDKLGSMWLTTSKGLTHFAFDEGGGKPTLTKVGEFTANLPHGGKCCVDVAGNLWVRSGDLWRITIRPAE